MRCSRSRILTVVTPLSRSWLAYYLLYLFAVTTVCAEENTAYSVAQTLGNTFSLPCVYPPDRVTDLSAALSAYWEIYDYMERVAFLIEKSAEYAGRCYVTAAPNFSLVCNDTRGTDQQYYRCVAVFPPVKGNYQRAHAAWVFLKVECK